MKTFQVELPLPPNIANPRSGFGHWRAKYNQLRAWKKRALQEILPLGREFPAEPWARARVTIEFHLWRKMDYDNLVARAKPVIDLFKSDRYVIGEQVHHGPGFYLDDSPDHIDLQVTQAQVPQARQGVSVLITRLA